jgi:hypothetical protein
MGMISAVSAAKARLFPFQTDEFSGRLERYGGYADL